LTGGWRACTIREVSWQQDFGWGIEVFKDIALRLGALLATLAVSLPAAAQDRAGIERDLAHQRFARSTLAQLDCDTLWYLRNSIFARHGYRFKTARGQQVFGTGGWTDNPQLSAVERHNVAEIQAAEKSRRCTEQIAAPPPQGPGGVMAASQPD
jgi:hypothetical protein